MFWSFMQTSLSLPLLLYFLPVGMLKFWIDLLKVTQMNVGVIIFIRRKMMICVGEC